jgi:hypothetical protein
MWVLLTTYFETYRRILKPKGDTAEGDRGSGNKSPESLLAGALGVSPGLSRPPRVGDYRGLIKTESEILELIHEILE